LPRLCDSRQSIAVEAYSEAGGHEGRELCAHGGYSLILR
jgi:hypothetical protein